MRHFTQKLTLWLLSLATAGTVAIASCTDSTTRVSQKAKSTADSTVAQAKASTEDETPDDAKLPSASTNHSDAKTSASTPNTSEADSQPDSTERPGVASEFMLGGGCEFVGTDTMPREVCKTNSYDDNPIIYKTTDGATCGSAPDGTGYIQSAPAGSSLGNTCETTTTDHPVQCDGKNNRCSLNFADFDVLGAYDVEIKCDDGGAGCPPPVVCGTEEVPEDGSDLYVTDDTRGSPNPQINLESHADWSDIDFGERVILSADPNDNDSFTNSTPPKHCGDNTYNWTVSGAASRSGSGKYFSYVVSSSGTHDIDLTVKDSVSPTPNQGSANESFNAVASAISNPQAVAQILTDAPYKETDIIDYDGTSSSGSGLSYQWTFDKKPSNSALGNGDLTNSSNDQFQTDEPGNYRLKLQVSNGNGSDTDTTSLIPVLPELDVEASVATDSPYSPSDTIALDGSQNYGKSSGYSHWDWEVVKAPSGSSFNAGDVFKDGSANGYQTATFDLDANGNFQFRLGMGDNSGNSGVGTTKVISVGTTLNADAELNGSGPYTVNNTITYNGSNSTGSIGWWAWRIADTPANYSGNFANGSPLGTGNGNGYKSGNFKPDETGNWTLELAVNSSTSNASDIDDVGATVEPASVSAAGEISESPVPPGPYAVGESIAYDGTNSTGSYDEWYWRVAQAPSNSSYDTSPNPIIEDYSNGGSEAGNFTPDAIGNYKLELEVKNTSKGTSDKELTDEFEVVECTEDDDCSGSTPFCDDGGGSPSYRCIQCTSNSDCTAPEVCASNTCTEPPDCSGRPQVSGDTTWNDCDGDDPEQFTVNMACTDPDGDDSNLSYNWQSCDVGTCAGDEADVEFDENSEGDTFGYEVKVTDEDGATTTLSESVNIKDGNDWPTNPSLTDDGDISDGETVTLTASADDKGDNDLRYSFSCSSCANPIDEGYGDKDEAQYTAGCADKGKRLTFDVTIDEDAGMCPELTANETVDVSGSGGAKPTAKFDWSNLDSNPPLLDDATDADSDGDTIQLDGTSSTTGGCGGSLSYEWDVTRPAPDGSTKIHTGATPQHTITSSADGIYEVTLTVDDGSATDSVTKTIAVCGTSQEGTQNSAMTQSEITLDGGGSSPACTGSTLSYEWEIIDPSGFGTDKTGQTVEYTAEDGESGEWTSKLKVEDDEGNTDTTIQKIPVCNPEPIAIALASDEHQSNDNFPATPPTPPSPPLEIDAGNTVFLEGGHSKDAEDTGATAEKDDVGGPNGSSGDLEYKWSWIHCPQDSDGEDADTTDDCPTLENRTDGFAETNMRVKFDAPHGDDDRTPAYKLQMSVKDDQGNIVTDKVSIKVKDDPPSGLLQAHNEDSQSDASASDLKAPLADDAATCSPGSCSDSVCTGMSTETVNTRNTVYLDGTASTDDESSPSDLTYSWNWVRSPQIPPPPITSPGPKGTAEFTPLVRGLSCLDPYYEVEMTVTDPSGQSDTDTVKIFVNNTCVKMAYPAMTPYDC